MNSKQFIKDRLRNLVEKFPQITFLYQFNEIDQTHIVEVLPFTKYEEDNDYKDAEGDLTYEFDRLFSPETIMFVSENSLTRVKKPEEVFKQECFAVWDNIVIPVLEDTELFGFNFLTGRGINDPKTEFQYSDESIFSYGNNDSASKNNYALAA